MNKFRIRFGLAGLWLVLAAIAFTPPAAAESVDAYMALLRAGFEGRITPPGSQFAVLTLNRAGQAGQPYRPAPPPYDPANPINFTAKAYGGPGQHAEALALAQLQGMWGRIGTNVAFISMYTHLFPCNQCAALLAGLQSTAPYSHALFFELGYLNTWATMTDQQILLSFTTLYAASPYWIITRACNGNDRGPYGCNTFQRRMLTCLLADPVVCRHCVNRTYSISVEVNDATYANARVPAAWYAWMMANIQIDRVHIANRARTCAQTSGVSAIGPVLNPNDPSTPIQPTLALEHFQGHVSVRSHPKMQCTPKAADNMCGLPPR